MRYADGLYPNLIDRVAHFSMLVHSTPTITIGRVMLIDPVGDLILIEIEMVNGRPSTGLSSLKKVKPSECVKMYDQTRKREKH